MALDGQLCQMAYCFGLGTRGRQRDVRAADRTGDHIEDALRPLGIKVNEAPLPPSRLWKLIHAAGARP